MRRRDIVTLLGGVAALPPFVARAQRTVPVIAYMTSSTSANGTDMTEFRAGLAAAGLVEGRNFEIEIRRGVLGATRQREVAADLVNGKAAILVAAGGSALIKAAVAAAASTLPVVFMFGGDPVKWGFVESLN